MKGKGLHGGFANALKHESTNLVHSTEWIRTVGLFGETEGFIFAKQDKVILTRSYQKHIMGINCNNKWWFRKHATPSNIFAVAVLRIGSEGLPQEAQLSRALHTGRIFRPSPARPFLGPARPWPATRKQNHSPARPWPVIICISYRVGDYNE
jgi:hypothetical protein